jgi:hypothetical protein
MNDFSAEHFTVCVLTRIYNSTAKVHPKDPGLDLSRPDNRRSIIEFVRNMSKDDISSTIFRAVHFPGSLDTEVEFPLDLIEEVSQVLAEKFKE